MRRPSLLVLAVPLLVIGFLLHLTARVGSHEKTKPQMVTVKGTLVKVAAIGGETTGRAIDLEKPLNIGGRALARIEIVDGKELDVLAGERVVARGSLAKRRGTERGEYWVLEVETLHTLDD